MNNDFAEMIVDYIRNMKIGESNSIGAIVKNVFNKELNVDELFDIQDIVMQKCEEQGIICDYSKNEGTIVGLPFDLEFIKKSNNLITNKLITKEEKINLAKNIFSQLEVQIDDIILSRIEKTNIDICSPISNQRGVNPIIIGDDGSYLICGSLKTLDSYIEDYKNGKRSNLESNEIIFKKKKESDVIWWVDNCEEFGKHEFSFDKVKVYNLFRDYPYKLSSEEIEIFDKENPYWADFFKTRKQNSNNYQSEMITEDDNLEKIKKLYFKDKENYFDTISPYLSETFDYNILSGGINDNCIRFELFDKANYKIAFFAINKNLFLLNYRYKHKMNLRGNSSEEIFSKLMNDLKSITQSWNLDYSDNGEYYWGLTLIQDNKCDLYVGKSISVVNWNDLSNAINNIIGELLVNTSKETSI